ncbi:MAG: cation:dicarboxylase symporter family transporter, partial [Deferribacteraceae bacterium]|nr:cation:dicarboxylase symporter family transporter [Deferribacteraceae bacterium]
MAEGKKGLFDWYFKSNLLMRILIGLILGAIVGIIFASVGGEGVAKATAFIKPFGDAFIRLLKMIIVPVVLFSLIVGCSSIPPSKLGRVGAKIMIYYIITTFCAAILGLIFALVTQPGRGISLSVGNAAAKEAAPTSMSKVILDIIPENIFQALSQGVILQIIFFALLAGIALAFMRDSKKENIKKSAELIYSFFEGMSEIIFTIVRW